jgi:hypothetical protein
MVAALVETFWAFVCVVLAVGLWYRLRYRADKVISNSDSQNL